MKPIRCPAKEKKNKARKAKEEGRKEREKKKSISKFCFLRMPKHVQNSAGVIVGGTMQIYNHAGKAINTHVQQSPSGLASDGRSCAIVN